MRSEELKAYIRKRGSLFWYTPGDKGETVGDELLVEHVLNYGTLDDVRELFRLMGLKRVAEIFFHTTGLSERRKNNYFPATANFFTLLFNRYAH